MLLLGEMVGEFVGWGGDGEIAGGLDSAQDGGLEARKGEIKTVDFGVRERIFVGVALFGAGGDRRTAWIGKTKNLGDFVKAFADGIVAGGADDFELVVGWHIDNLGVAAGDN